MFVGRQKELTELEKLYASDQFQCVVIYGRRRVGKTSLIAEFIKNKEAIYFTGQETNAKENLAAFSNSIFSLSGDFHVAGASFAGYKEALDAVFSMAEKRRMILVIDEYPYLASAYKGISSLLQAYIDQYKETSQLFLILCGSSLSFMEEQVLGYQSPIFGRRTAQFKIMPFDFFETMDYFKDTQFSQQDIALLYGITGGIPLYLSLMDKQQSVVNNIKRQFLSPTGYLFEEPGNLLKQECREPAQYNAIVKAIAGGASRLSEISTKVGLETAVCSAYLSKLLSIGIVKKEYPLGEETGKKTIYRLADHMFQFWYRFVPDVISLIQRGEPDFAFSEIEDQVPSYMGGVFENICIEYLWQQNFSGNTPVRFREAGRWWGNNAKKKEECEIDILAVKKLEAIFCECKWRNEDIGSEVLQKLIERGELFHYTPKYYYLFSKTGFTTGVKADAEKMGNVALISFDQMAR